MPTWNDYTESTLVSPSYQNGYGYADLVAYHNIEFISIFVKYYNNNLFRHGL